MKTQASPEPEFYVGYLNRAPHGLRRFRRLAVSVIAAGVVAVAIALAAAQQRFAPAVFEFLEYRTFDGFVEESPYPSLLVERPGAAGAGYSRYFLVGEGKFGANASVAGLNGKRVTAEGRLIYLNGQTLVEIKQGSVTPQSSPPPSSRPVARNLGSVTLDGEIVDSKCYLGVMNPGRGKVHKACAVRCISGGVPPALLVTDESGNSIAIILAGSGGKAVKRAVLGLVGEPVRVTGQLENSADALVLYTEPERIERIARSVAERR